jgi:predicted PurR-regulated permease PerM
VLAAFMLVESIDQPDKLLKAVRAGNKIPEKVLSFNRDIRSYLAINAWIGFLCAAINTIFLIILGVDFALMWGVLSFIMSFIPMVGFIIALVPPAFMALLQFGVGRAVIVIIGFIIINTLTDNIIYPRLVGKGLNISPLVVILAVFFWAWVLGPLGAILAVPIMLMIKQLILESSDESRWLAVLMEPAHDDE